MRKVLKWIGILLGILLLVLLLAGVVLSAQGSSRLNENYDVQAEALTIPTDQEAIERGRHLSEALTLCQACHGDNLEGSIFDDEPLVSQISASNLTAGDGGVGSKYTDEDWVRAIRHGVNSDGRGLIIMHSDRYHNLSEEDLGAVIAFAKSMPPVDNELPDTKALLLGNIMVALGMFDVEGMPLIPAEVIDHNAGFAPAVAQERSVEYGQYLTSITVCTMCHGSDYKGGPPIEPGAESAPDITPDGELKGVSEQGFIDLFRAHAEEEEEEYMPWELFNKMTNDELGSIWRYLQTFGGS